MKTMIEGQDSFSPNEFKVITSFLIMALGLLGGFLPKLIHREGKSSNGDNNGDRDDSSRKISCAVNAFTGGVFLSSAMLHLLPDATSNKQLQTFMAEKFFTSEDYPFANLFFTLGFIILLSTESMSHEYYQSDCFCDSCSCSERNNFVGSGGVTEESEVLQIQTLTYNSVDAISYTSVSDTDSHHHQDLESAGSRANDFCNFRSNISYKSLDEEDLVDKCQSNGSTQVTSTHCHRQAGDASCCGSIIDDDSIGISIDHEDNINNSEIQRQQKKDSSSPPPIMSFVIFLSLSLHSIMAGIGIGAEPGCAWDILFAILVHKSVAAFALGVEFMNNGNKMKHRTYIILMVLFAQMTPLGILLGWGLTEHFSGEEGALSGICIALSAGTFFYVGVMEIIAKEFKDRKNVGLKISTLCVGFLIVAILAQYV